MDRNGGSGRTPWFGGDYNPEQWPDATLDADLDAFDHLGVDTVTLPVFGWARLHPAKSRYDLGWLDRVVDTVAAHGIGVVLATPTAAQPPWMSAAYPEMLPVDAAGHRRTHGGRVNYCPSSPAYRDAAAEVAGTLAEHYTGHDALRLWHVNNEYGPVCFCDRCLDGFRRWAADRYGDLAALNDAWANAVWGNTLTDWAEIEFPSLLNAMAGAPDSTPTPGRVRYAPNPSLALDHARFCSDVLLECYLTERREIAEHSPDVPITTNFHGPVQAVDWHRWAPHCDLVSWDSYPVAGEHWAHPSFGHDLARGASGRGELLVMEASPGPVNWHELCALKRPGEVRLEALQAVAHGSRGVLYFQLRQAVGGAELNHAALIPRHGRLDTRTGHELAATSADLRALAAVPPGLAVDARVALVFDWPSWWAHHNTPGLDQRSRYLTAVRDMHRALAEHGHVVDVVSPHGPFDRYDAVVAPLLHVVDDTTLDTLDAFVRSGGVLVTTTGSGVTGVTAQVHREGADPRWRALVGAWIEETDAQPPDRPNRVRFTDGEPGADDTCGRELFDIVRTDTADVVAVFADDFYAGSPAVTVNAVDDGTVVYVASIDADLVATALDRHVPATLPVTLSGSAGVECVTWRGGDGHVVYVLNHGDVSATVGLGADAWTDVLTGVTHRDTVQLAARQAAVLVAERRATSSQPPTSNDSIHTNQGESP